MSFNLKYIYHGSYIRVGTLQTELCEWIRRDSVCSGMGSWFLIRT